MLRAFAGFLLLISTLLISACGANQPTAIPFGTYSAQNVIDALQAAGLDLQNIQRAMQVGRDAPTTYNDRYIFEIPSIAPQGGQILIFSSDANMQAWRDYIELLRQDRVTRRDVVYVYENANVMVQVNSNLPVDDANVFRDTIANLP